MRPTTLPRQPAAAFGHFDPNLVMCVVLLSERKPFCGLGVVSSGHDQRRVVKSRVRWIDRVGYRLQYLADQLGIFSLIFN